MTHETAWDRPVHDAAARAAIASPFNEANRRIRAADPRIGSVIWTTHVQYQDDGTLVMEGAWYGACVFRRDTSEIIVSVRGRTIGATARAAIGEAIVSLAELDSTPPPPAAARLCGIEETP
jgi:hypothetical protein